jgi:N-acetylmuramoyl-L-alanine amidase
MPDEPEFIGDETEETPPEIPASVTFMEMMRRAAAAANPPPAPPPAEPLKAETPPLPVPQENAQERKRRHAAALEVQRIQRVQRRKTRRRQSTVGLLGGLLRSFMVVLVAAGLMATIFVWWTPTQFLSSDVRSELGQAQAAERETLIPTVQPTPNWLQKIGVVSGHRGPELDPGAVCPDGLTEADINFNVAQMVVRELRGQGYSVDLLDEFDPRLEDYQAAALVSIHANTCQPFAEPVSGYLVAAAAARVTARIDDQLLVDCLAQYYEQHTGLHRHYGLTEDMTNYHTFREIHPLTPAAIIELGFMLADRALLTEHPEIAAKGVVDGVLCYLQPGARPVSEDDSA